MVIILKDDVFKEVVTKKVVLSWSIISFFNVKE